MHVFPLTLIITVRVRYHVNAAGRAGPRVSCVSCPFKKKRGTVRSDVCSARRAGGKLTLAERRETASEKRWVKKKKQKKKLYEPAAEKQTSNKPVWRRVDTWQADNGRGGGFGVRFKHTASGNREVTRVQTESSRACTPILVKARRKGR